MLLDCDRGLKQALIALAPVGMTVVPVRNV